MKRVTWLILVGFVVAVSVTSVTVSGRIIGKSGIKTLYPSDYPHPGCPYATLQSHTKPKKFPCHCGLFHVWSRQHNGCVGLVNTSCALGRICDTNSYCNYDDWCECTLPYTSTRHRTCLLPLNQQLNVTSMGLVPFPKSDRSTLVPTTQIILLPNTNSSSFKSNDATIILKQNPLCLSFATRPIFKYHPLALPLIIISIL